VGRLLPTHASGRLLLTLLLSHASGRARGRRRGLEPMTGGARARGQLEAREQLDHLRVHHGDVVVPPVRRVRAPA